jgi:uncharacterized protein YjiS (DUF1127 family)
MHVANYNERTLAAAFIARQELVVRAAAANAENISQIIHPACVTVIEIARKWLVEPIMRQHSRRQLFSQLASLDDRILTDLGITRSEIETIVRNAFPSAAQTREQPQTATPVQPVPASDLQNDTKHPMAA